MHSEMTETAKTLWEKITATDRGQSLIMLAMKESECGLSRYSAARARDEASPWRATFRPGSNQHTSLPDSSAGSSWRRADLEDALPVAPGYA
jgi:hypothetical protein